ncbi:MAG TPA: hypothetical protein VHO90_18355 [Bacteroidales bacterium]|nr:hypothetical protein [Bacteroidales bacterium]
MKKKSKGKTPQQLKLEQAHQRNLYLQKLQVVMDAIACEPAFHLLGWRETETLYRIRIRPLKLKFAQVDGDTVPDEIARFMNEFLTVVFKKTPVTIDNEGLQVSLYDFNTFVETISIFWQSSEKMGYSNAQKFIERFPLFTNGYREKRDEAFDLVEEKIKQLAWMFTHLPEYIVWIEPVERHPTGDVNDTSILYNNYLVHMEATESETLDIGGNKRTIFRVGIGTEDGILWMIVIPEKLGMKGLMNRYPLKVYIQKHAVDRIKERLGDFFDKLNFFLVSKAIFDCEAVRTEEDSYLISCKYESIKLGYFKASVIGDKILIRTFLFLTNNGTPEGKKLETLLGVQKEDKKYLGIDKLNLFINSDIEQNEKLKAIFHQAGCGDLFRVKKHMMNDQDQMIHCASSFAKYLGLENQDDNGLPKNNTPLV